MGTWIMSKANGAKGTETLDIPENVGQGICQMRNVYTAIDYQIKLPRRVLFKFFLGTSNLRHSAVLDFRPAQREYRRCSLQLRILERPSRIPQEQRR